MDNRSIKKLEADLWESADLLRAGSKLTSNQYCMPVLGLLFLRYAYSRFKLVEAEILKDRPMRNGRKMPVEAKDFSAKSALFLPREAQYDYLVNLPENIASADLKNIAGQAMNSLGEVVNNAMELVEQQSEQLAGVLPKSYTDFSNELLGELLRIFNNNALDEVGGDVIGRIYEYFLNKFAKNIASDDGVFFTPKSLVKMIVNILEPTSGVLLDPACGSGGMFVQTGDFVNEAGLQANSSMTFYGQEKVEYNAQLCLMNMAVHGLTGVIKSGDEANTFYHDAHNLEGCCDYVMANPPFNVDKVKAESTFSAGRLPFGCPKENKNKEIGNANYLWISYFYAYLNEKGRAGFVMASSATDSQGSDKDIREKLVKTGHVDVMIVYERFKQITEENVVDTFNNCYVGYWDDFRNFFYKFNIYKCISKNRICDVLKGLRWNTYHILQDIDKILLSCHDCNHNKNSFWIEKEEMDTLNPDGEKIKNVFIRDDKYYIRINDEFKENTTIEGFYNKLCLGSELHRLDYLIMNIIGLQRSCEDNSDLYVGLGKILDTIREKRNIM